MRKFAAAVAIGAFLCGCGQGKEASTPPRKVWLVNALDVPLNVSFAGHKVRVDGHSLKAIETSAAPLVFITTTIDGREVDRAETSATGDVAYNILGASIFFLGTESYVPLSKAHIPVVGYQPPNEQTLVRQKIVERGSIDAFLEPAPVVMQTETDGEHSVSRLRLGNDWKGTVGIISSQEGYDEARKFAVLIASVEPDDEGANQVVDRLTPKKSREQEEMELFQMAPSWGASSKDGKAVVEQKPVGQDMCNTTCIIDKAPIWTVNQCLGQARTQQFISSDCRHLIVINMWGEGSWRYSPVLFIYVRGQLYKTMTAADFVTSESDIRAVGDTHFSWMRGVARLSAEGRHIEFETEDGRTHKVPLGG